MSPVMIPTFVFDALAFAGAALVIAGVIAFIVGVIGTPRLHDGGLAAHPQCARCAYELRSTKLPLGNCPECGADLSKPDAVVVARKRVRWALVVLGVVLLACAGLATWKLDAKGRTALRGALAEMSSTRANLDALLADGDAAPFAREALRSRVGSAGSPRTIPPDALLDPLLDALTEATDRHATGATAADPHAVLRTREKAEFLLDALDERELERLERLAVEELLASDGDKRRLLWLVDLAREGPAGEQSRDRMRALLSATPEGRALLDWQPGSSEIEEGSVGAVGLASVMRDPRTMDEAAREGELALIVDEMRLEPVGGGAARIVPVVWPPSNRDKPWSPLAVSFLADAPPGKYRLSFEGALVRNANVPRMSGGRWNGFQKGMPRDAFDVAAALKTEGARAIERSLEIEVTEPTLDAMRFSDDAEKVGRVAKLLEYVRFNRNEDGAIGIDYDALMGAAPKFLSSLGAPRTPTGVFLSMLFELRQDGRAMSLGAVRMSGNSLSKYNIPVDPKCIDPVRSFELFVTPTTMWNGEFNGRENGLTSISYDDAAWAGYTLRFARMDAAPEVVTTARPLEKSVGTPRVDEEARSAVERWARSLRIFEPLRRSDGSIVLRSSTRVRDVAASSTDAEEEQAPSPLACDWPSDLALSGWIEVRRDGRLIAERVRVAGPVDEWKPIPAIRSMAGGPESSEDNAPDARWTASPIVIRYIPDARVGASDGSGPFAFVGLPFELRELPTQDGDAGRGAVDAAATRGTAQKEQRAMFELVWLDATADTMRSPTAGGGSK